MRTIKFRGKDIETGEWIYGHFFQRLGHYPAIVEPRPRDGKVMYYEIAVEDETVGQFIDVRDYNQDEICEGDIVHVSCLNYTGLAEIKFVEGSFCMVGKDWIESFNGFDADSLDIIGNIHDNPELLKGGNDEND